MKLHVRIVEAIQKQVGERIELVAPLPGLFRIAVHPGDVVRGATVLGELEVLGRFVTIVAPERAAGAVVAVREPELARPAVDYGALLVTLDPNASATTPQLSTASATPDPIGGLVFRAPTSGRFYGRPGPDKAAFVGAGTELSPGSTICLLEVMKTFHRVTYSGPGLPERARVRDVLVIDGADVSAGDPLLALDALDAK